MKNKNRNLLIVGGGWAGIAAAIKLVRHGKKVTLLESARQLGGRARAVQASGLCVDNGQHLLLGAYHETLGLLAILGLKESDLFERLPLQIHQYRGAQVALSLQAAALPAPLHLAAGILLAKGINLRDRLAALWHWQGMISTPIPAADDISVRQWLLQHHQPIALIHACWEPLCLAALNTPAHQASAILFRAVLQTAFRGDRHNADVLFPKKDLTSILAGPAMEFLEGAGGNVLLSRTVTGLQFRDAAIAGVETRTGFIEAEQVILATNFESTQRLLAQYESLQATNVVLQRLKSNPICTVYLQLPGNYSLPYPIMASLDSPAQWFFDRALCQQPGLIAAVISGDGPHMELDTEALCQRVKHQFAALLPHAPKPEKTFCIRERRATLACTPGIQQHRPTHVTAVANLYLAGDYLQSDLPATLEAAVQSGLACATKILT